MSDGRCHTTDSKTKCDNIITPHPAVWQTFSYDYPPLHWQEHLWWRIRCCVDGLLVGRRCSTFVRIFPSWSSSFSSKGFIVMFLSSWSSSSSKHLRWRLRGLLEEGEQLLLESFHHDQLIILLLISWSSFIFKIGGEYAACSPPHQSILGGESSSSS